jgi:hypothetical protein
MSKNASSVLEMNKLLSKLELNTLNLSHTKTLGESLQRLALGIH